MRTLLGRRTPEPTRHIVLARPEADLEQVAAAVAAAGAEVVWRLPVVHGLIVTCPGPATCAALLGIAGVAAVEDDSQTALPHPLRTLGAPAAAPAGRRALVAWGVARMGAPWAWTRTRGEGVKVAIIDTGVDWTHPALARNIHGGVNILAPGEPPDDDHGHGTHVAGIIAAADGPGVSVGVAPRCALYAVKAFDAHGAAATGDVLLALEWCATHGMQVVNMSFGQPEPSAALARAVAGCLRRGMVLVAAAGNSHFGPVEVPARLAGVLAVGGVNRWGGAIWGSARGPEVALAAPGARILSLAPGGGMHVLSGTSMAAAHVAGAVALLLSARPGLSPAEVRQVLTESAEPLPWAGRAAVGAGMVRIDRALGLG